MRRLGYDPAHYGTHSLRIGGATTAMQQPSASILTIKLFGMWLSDAYMTYLKPTVQHLRGLQLEMLRAGEPTTYGMGD